MSTLYLIVNAGYEYSVDCAFSTEEGAECYLRRFDRLNINHGLRIDYTEIDPELPSSHEEIVEKIALGYRTYRVYAQRSPIKVEETQPYSIEDLLEYESSYVGGHWDNLIVKLWAKSEEEAIELAKEKAEKFMEECKAKGWFHG